MIDLRFRPLPVWSEKTKLGTRRSAFKLPFNKTLDMLEGELHKMRARDILVEAGFTLQDIRNDGWPRGSAQATHPGVILYCSTPDDGKLRFPCGTYPTWQANLHAIALTLDRLRDIDRYGVTLGHQQYMGFKAIAPPAPGMTVEEAAAVVDQISGVTGRSRAVVDAEIYRSLYRQAAMRCHPDQCPAATAEWLRLQQAKDVLDQHHKTA